MNTYRLCICIIFFVPSMLLGQSDSTFFFLQSYANTQEILWLEKALSQKGDNISKLHIGEANRQMGLYYFNHEEIVESFPYFLDAIKSFAAVSDTVGLAKSHINIALAYHLSQENELALKYAERSLFFAEQLQDLNMISVILGNLGAMYETESKETDKVLETYERLLSVCKEIKDSIGLQVAYNNIGVFYSKENQPQKAISYYENALKLAGELNLFEDRCRIIINLLDVYTKSGNFLKSNAMVDLSKDTCVEVDIRLQSLRARRLSEFYEATGDFKNALEQLAQYQMLHDSIYSEERTRIIRDLSEEYESEKRMQIIALLEKDRELQNRKLEVGNLVRNGLLGITLLLGFFGGLLYLQRNKLASEKSRSETLLLNILPADIAEELKENGHSPARQFNNVTVLFTDFVNFTKVSEHLTPQELVSEIHKNFTAFDEIIQRNGLEKIKTIGDAYLAVCGMPIETPDHAYRCMMAALEILEYVKMNQGLFDIRIGLHSGPVVAGIVGVKKYAYDLWGDTVNTAARMEQNSEAGKINLSQSTFEFLKDRFEFIYRGKIEAKNKGQIDMYFYQSVISS